MQVSNVQKEKGRRSSVAPVHVNTSYTKPGEVTVEKCKNPACVVRRVCLLFKVKQFLKETRPNSDQTHLMICLLLWFRFCGKQNLFI